MTGHMTPKQAADRAKCGRTSVMRALERQELRAIRDNRGRWQISPEALEDWLSMRSPVRHYPQKAVVTPETVRSDTTDTEITALKVALAKSEAEAEGLRQRLADTQAERDRLAHLLSEALKARPVGFFTRLFGR